MEYYNPNAMKPEDKIESLFIKWYNRNQSENFDFQTNILSNCRSNVDILRHACLRFRKMFIEITATEGTPEIDPFESCITIASACNLVIRTNFLESESIGIIPPHDTDLNKINREKLFSGLDAYRKERTSTFSMH